MIIIIAGVPAVAVFRSELGQPLGVEGDADVSPSPLAVEEGDFAQMLLDNFLNDRESETGP